MIWRLVQRRENQWYNKPKANQVLHNALQEALLEEQFREAMKALRQKNLRDATELLIGILTHPAMKEREFMGDITDIDSMTRAADSTNIKPSNMTKLFFAANFIAAELVEDPLHLYTQVNLRL